MFINWANKDACLLGTYPRSRNILFHHQQDADDGKKNYITVEMHWVLENYYLMGESQVAEVLDADAVFMFDFVHLK